MNATVKYLQEALMVLTDKLQHRDSAITDLSEQVEVLTKERDDLQEKITAMCKAIPGYDWSGDSEKKIADLAKERYALAAAAKLARKALALIGEELNDVLLLGHQSPFSRETTLKTREAIASLKTAGVQ